MGAPEDELLLDDEELDEEELDEELLADGIVGVGVGVGVVGVGVGPGGCGGCEPPQPINAAADTAHSNPARVDLVIIGM